ncbi:MAG: hypothetical protein H5T62_10185 [Anaerolineae bacterium]|nr:hypothetical protein [Anaerolineae bacterium]
MTTRKGLHDRGASIMNQLGRNLRTLRITMLLGIIFDWTIAILVLSLPVRTAALWGITDAGELEVWRLCGLLLAIPALFYIMTVIDIKRNVSIVAAAIVGRICLGAFLVAHVIFSAAPVSWLALGLGNLGFAAMHSIFFKLSDFDFWPILRRAGNPPF